MRSALKAGNSYRPFLASLFLVHRQRAALKSALQLNDDTITVSITIIIIIMSSIIAIIISVVTHHAHFSIHSTASPTPFQYQTPYPAHHPMLFHPSVSCPCFPSDLDTRDTVTIFATHSVRVSGRHQAIRVPK